MSIPTSSWYRFTKLRIMKPAPASSTSVSVSWATMRAAVQRRARTPPEPDRPPSFMISFTFVFEMCSAGARPKRMPVAMQTIEKKPNTRASMLNVIQYGRPMFWDSPSNH